MADNDDNPPPKSMLYTRSGDTGETSLFGGGRVPKDHPRVEAYGTVDELNSAIGAAIAFLPSQAFLPAHGEGTRTTSGARPLDIPVELTSIQNELFNIGAELASETASDKAAAFAAAFTDADAKIAALESLTDKLDASLPPLETFILPSGSQAGAHTEPVNPDITRYLNRLSDLLFALARYVNHAEGHPESPWHKG
jgi:cob(I)alamin adenosyltransferase